MPRAGPSTAPDPLSSDEENTIAQNNNVQRKKHRNSVVKSSKEKVKVDPSTAKKRKSITQNGGGDAASNEDDDDDEEEEEESDNGNKKKDAEQDHRNRREIRHSYREIISDIKDNQPDYTDPKSDKLMNALAKANKLHGKVSKTREAALDSQLVLSIAQCGRQKAQRLHTDFFVFNPKNFLLKAKYKIANMTLENEAIDTDDWTNFGRKYAQPLFRTAPTFQYMFGAIAREPPVPKQRKERRVMKDKETNAKTDVKQLKSLKEASTEEATSNEVEHILQLLHEETKPEKEGGEAEPIYYFDFVVNPESFSQTVENIFYTSFLIKDGLAKISLDADKLPVIEWVEPPKEGTEEARDRNENKTQVVITLTMQEWKDIVEVFGITESMIPTRAPHFSVGGGNKRRLDST